MPERVSTREEYGILVRRHGRDDEVLWHCLKHHRESYGQLLDEQFHQGRDGELRGISVCYDSSRAGTCRECTAAAERWAENRPAYERLLGGLVADPRTEWQLVEVESHALTFKLSSVSDLDGHVHDIVPEEHRARLASFEVLVRVSVTTHGPRAREAVWR